MITDIQLGGITNGTDPIEHPQLIFFTELNGEELWNLLTTPGILDLLIAHKCGIALALPGLDEPRARVVQLLNEHAIPLEAWLLLPPDEGYAFNLQNYPGAVAQYRAFHSWAQAHNLHFEAVGLDIEPPLAGIMPDGRWSLHEIIRRLWLARDNALYPAARAAYIELIAGMHHDGYEVHSYHMPVIADDRRAGTTLIQRALDIVDLPTDLDVLMCSSGVPIEALSSDLGGALIASYGSSAGAIGIGGPSGGDSEEEVVPQPWYALYRDLLLAAKYTDTIYIFALEDWVRRKLLQRLATIDWRATARPVPSKRLLIGMLRTGLFLFLIGARFGLTALGWVGWGLALVLWLRGRRK